MSTERDTERLLRQWLDEGPTRAADRLVEHVEERIDRQRQRPVWRLNWRNLIMNRTIGSFAAGMAVVAVALIGYNVLAGQGKDGSGGIGAPTEPSAPAALTPSPAPTPAPQSAEPVAADSLTVTFTAPAPNGWDQGDTTVTKGEEAAVEILEDRSVMSAYPACIYGPAPGIGRTASDIAEALAAREGMDASAPDPVEVGGLAGHVLDLAVADGWTDTCAWWEDPGTPMVPTFGAFDPKNNWFFNGVVADEQQRLYVLDKPSGGNVVVLAWASSPEIWASNEADIEAIIGGIEFETGS
jgi:hypothetical protein